MKRYAALCVAVLLLGLNTVVWYAIAKETHAGSLTVHFLDIGQGDSIFIESPTGTQVLIDGGPNGKILRELGEVMPFYDRSIDAVIATHPDQDHIAGLIDVLERYEVPLFLHPGVESDTGTYVSLMQEVKEKEIPEVLARRGMSLALGGGVHLDILFPDRDVRGMETNDASIVARLVYGETEVLLTGDSPTKIESYLLSIGTNLKSDVLKAGHHGSRTSSSEFFVAAVDPEYAVISAGKDNKYGHPHKEVMDILKKLGIKVLRTDEGGRITLYSDGSAFVVK